MSVNRAGIWGWGTVSDLEQVRGVGASTGHGAAATAKQDRVTLLLEPKGRKTLWD